MPTRLFVPSPDHVPPAPRHDEPDDLRDVLASVTVIDSRGVPTELVIGLDLGRVIRVIALAKSVTLPDRVRRQLEFHTGRQPSYVIRADELYVMDVQAVERQPDTPGADDPLFLYGVLRGPYAAALADGVVAIEGQLATTRGPLLDGLAQGITRAFHYETGACGTRCVHAVLEADLQTGAVVLAFPLVPMGEDGSNELVAGQLVHDVLGAMRTDLGDDLAIDPVPVPNRRMYERELTAAGWAIDRDHAVHRGGKGRLASLFSPGKKQRLPREVTLDEYPVLIAPHVARLEGWPEPARTTLHVKLGLREPPPVPPPPRVVAPPMPPPQWPFVDEPRPTPAPPKAPGAAALEWLTGRPVTPSADEEPAARSRQEPAKPARSRQEPSSAKPLPGMPPARSTPPPPEAPFTDRPSRPRPPTTPPPIPPRARPPTQPPPIPPHKRRVPRSAATNPRTVAKGLTPETGPALWIKKLVDEHCAPDRPPPRVTTPGRGVGATVPDWMLDLVDKEFDDDK